MQYSYIEKLQFYCSKEHAIIMDEFDQINQFVEEVGDEVEVQWGVSIDDSLGAAVRVTIIATGYAVSDIPSLQEEAGKISVEEAMETNYAGLTNIDKPKEDEKPTEIDLTSMVGNDVIPTAPRTQGHDADTIEISFEDEDEQTEQHPEEEKRNDRASRFGWIRGGR